MTARRGALAGGRSGGSRVVLAALVVLATGRATAAPLVTRVGVEYALAGHAAAFAEIGLPAVKYLPDTYTWGKMQASATAPVDFSVTDRYVTEFQGAGFAELVLALRSTSAWGSVECGLLACPQPQPRPEYRAHFAAWVGAVVERYDGDGVADLPGLVRPLRIVEIGVELSSYEPEPVADYLVLLDLAYRAAHAASPEVQVAHAAFLATTAFTDHPGPAEYEAAFAAVDARIMAHSLADIRAVLDRPELFDLVNFHALGDPTEIEDTVAWLGWEMAARGYRKDIIISDTITTSFVGWGAADRCTGAPGTLGVVSPPATEADRCRLAEYFQRLIARDQATLEWTRAFAAEDVVKRVVVACEQGVMLVDTWSTEDIVVATLPLFQAGAGVSAWAGMVEATYNWLTGEREVVSRRPAFFALAHLMSHLAPSTDIARVATPPGAGGELRLYQLNGPEGPRWVAWLDPGHLLLPGDPVPERLLSLAVAPGRVVLERTPTRADQSDPDLVELVSDGRVEIVVTPTPLVVVGADGLPAPRRGGPRQGGGRG